MSDSKWQSFVSLTGTYITHEDRVICVRRVIPKNNENENEEEQRKTEVSMRTVLSHLISL